MRLEIYLADHCENCQEAARLAVLAASVPGVEVCMVNLDDPAANVPPTVVAAPTYILDGRIISLGNPYPDELLRLLRQDARQSDACNERDNDDDDDKEMVG